MVQISVKRMLRTRGALVAAVTALAVGITLVVGHVLHVLISMIPVGTTSGLYDLQSVFPWAQFGLSLLSSVLPFTLGYFVALWVVAPITERLGVGHVVTRAILATGIGATVWFVVLGLIGLVSVATSAHLYDPSDPPNFIGAAVGSALKEALTGLIVLLPLGVLGGVLQWVWRGANPAPHHIEGLIDV